MNPYLNWLVVLLVAGGLGWYYKKRSSRARGAPTKPNAEKGEHASTNKKGKRRVKKPDDVASSSASVKEETYMNAAQAVPDSSTDTGMDNLQFAREFSKVKDGDALSAAPSKNKSQPNKQSNKKKNGNNNNKNNKNGLPEPQVSTSASSTTTGAEADDDMSPIDSPRNTPIAATADVSDMLEEPAPAASVLRVTGSVEADGGQKKQKQENFKVAETKKQRQRRMKKENNRALIEDAEQQRRALLEKQLHTAREHERQEAAATKSKPPVTNSWKQPTPLKQDGNAQKTRNTTGALLDTFEPNHQQQKQASSTENSTQRENLNKPASESMEKSWASNLPSEEEQMRLLSSINSENEWTTVPKRKKDKQKNRNQTKVAGSMSGESVGPEAPAPKAEAAAQSERPSVNSAAEAVLPLGDEGHPLDSTWAA